MTLENRIKLIRSVPFFSLLTDDDIKKIAALMSEVSVKQGEIIVKEDELIDFIYIIADGTADVTRRIQTVEGDIHLPLTNLHRGETIGLSNVGFFSRNIKRTATVTATSNMLLLKISVIAFSQFMTASSRLYVSLKSSADKLLQSNFIKYAEPFAFMSVEKIQLLEECIEKIEAQTGDILFQKDELGDRFYFLIEGIVEIINEKKEVITTINAPEVIGESGILRPSVYRVTARVKEPSKLIMLTEKNIRTIIKYPTQEIFNTLIDDDTFVPNDKVVSYIETCADTQKIMILRNSENELYFRLSEVGANIWQEISKGKTFSELVDLTLTTSPKASKSDVLYLLSRLIKENFLTIEKQHNILQARKNLFHKVHHIIGHFFKKWNT